MALSFFDMTTLGAMAIYIEALQSNRTPLLGEALFPAKKKLGLNLDWIKGYDNLPVMLQPSAFDAKPLLRERVGIEQESTKMPFFRESARFGEQDRQNMLAWLDSRSGQPFVQEILNRLYDDVNALIDGAMLVPEAMRMGLLVDGTFSIASPTDSGQYVNYNYNYDPNNTWKTRNRIQVTTPWSDHANSTPVNDILELKKAAAQRGHTLTRMIVGLTTWNDLVANEAARLDFLDPVYADRRILTDAEWMTYYTRKLGLTIAVYDKEYFVPGTNPAADPAPTANFFYPQAGNATFLTNANPGYTWYGTTPEEADLMSGNKDADVRIINTGVAVSQKKESLPVNIINWVSEIVLPSFENMNTVYNLYYT